MPRWRSQRLAAPRLRPRWAVRSRRPRAYGAPVDIVLANQPSVGLTIDGNVLPQSIEAAFASGDFNRVPLMEGTTHDEWRVFVGFDEFVDGPLTSAEYPAPAHFAHHPTHAGRLDHQRLQRNVTVLALSPDERDVLLAEPRGVPADDLAHRRGLS